MSIPEQIVQAIDAAANRLIGMSRQIHDHPELRFQEHFAAKTLTETLEAFGLPPKSPSAIWRRPFAPNSDDKSSRKWRFWRSMTRSQTATLADTI